MANVKYKYLGYGITNNNGVATLDYDANGDPLQNSGLVGTGAGKLDIVGSLDDLSNIRINYSPSTITDTGGTYTLSATVTNNNVAVNGETVCFNLYKVSDGSLVDTVTGVTNSSGVVSVSYVGKDAGELYIKCECLERMISSEIYTVIDGIWYDNFSSDTLWMYMNGRVDTVYTDGIEVTATGSSPYVRIRQNYLPLSQVKGKKIHFEYTVEKPSNKAIQATIYKEINGNYVSTTSQYTTENTVSLEVDVGDEVTNIIFQMTLINFSSGESLKIKEVKVYPV